MKTKELIRRLMEADPSGEIECCIGNRDIHFVAQDPAYWDGRLQVLIRDENEKQYYNIIGAKYVSSGYKIVIHTLSISDAIENDPDLPVDYSNCGNPETAARYKDHDDKTRQMTRDIERESELRLFHEWVKKTANEMTGNRDYLLSAATEFFDKNLSRNDPFPKEILEATTKVRDDGWTEHASYATRRSLQWDSMIKIEFDGMDWHFSLNNDKKS